MAQVSGSVLSVVKGPSALASSSSLLSSRVVFQRLVWPSAAVGLSDSPSLLWCDESGLSSCWHSGGLLDDVVFLLDKAGAAFKFDKAHAGRPHTHPHGLRLDVWNSVLRC